MESLAAPAIIASLWMRNAPSFLFKRHISQDVTEDELKKNKKTRCALWAASGAKSSILLVKRLRGTNETQMKWSAKVQKDGIETQPLS